MEDIEKTRGQWSSNLGFILAAAGSAVGLGNIWKFPYLTGQNGGAAFVLVYLIAIFLIGVPIMLGEMSIGRNAQLNAIGAYRKLSKEKGKNWTWLGVMGVVAGFIILSYYSVIGGWVTNYMVQYLTGGIEGQPSKYFEGFISQNYMPIWWHFIFMGLTVLIVIRGVSGGIEKSSKIMLPALFILLIIIMVRSLTLPNASLGVDYYIKPDFSKITPEVIIAALGQVFFSLSLGMGCMITYGSYLSKQQNLQRSAILVPSMDTLVALLAGFVILPAVFSFGLKPGQGPGLIFVTLPQVFLEMPFGAVFGTLFFILIFFAAITSSISLLEVIASYFIDQFKWSRRKAVISMAFFMFLLGIPCSLSFGCMGNYKVFDKTFFDCLDYLASNIMLPLGGFFMCLFISEIWGLAAANQEISNNGSIPFKSKKMFDFMIKWVSPMAVFIILVDPFAQYIAEKILHYYYL